MSLYSEVHGSGPVLLLIPGGNGDAGGYQPLTQELAGRYTVVSYDRRGFGRSAAGPVEAGSVRAGPVEALPVDEAQRFATDVEDAAGLLDRYGGGHGYVFGSSSGAIIALDLLRRYPERAARLVAHEPPLVRLLPDGRPPQVGEAEGVHGVAGRDERPAPVRRDRQVEVLARRDGDFAERTAAFHVQQPDAPGRVADEQLSTPADEGDPLDGAEERPASDRLPRGHVPDQHAARQE